jgi:hypothetical protein
LLRPDRHRHERNQNQSPESEYRLDLTQQMKNAGVRGMAVRETLEKFA